MQKYISYLAVATLFSTGLFFNGLSARSAGELERPAQASARGAKEDPGFDIINKSGHSITIRLINDYEPVIRKAVVKSASFFGKTETQSAPIDINKPTLLVVWDKALSNPENSIYTVGVNIAGEGTPQFFNNWTIQPKPSHVYHFKPGKSIYVTLDKGGILRPQTGPRKGATGKTEAGYPLANQVKENDILSYRGTINEKTGELES